MKINENTDRIAGLWQIEKKEVNGSNQTDNFKASHINYVLSFTPEGAFTETYADAFGDLQIFEGSWLFLNNVKELKLSDNTQDRIYDIIELTTTILTIQLLNTPDETLFYFVR
ncbi:MAG: lipocalin family protein [Fimbriimonadaceae bacterium]|nr:lipocalin family protein [Chitinophagales bacterium]